MSFRVCRVQGSTAQEERNQLTEACLDANVLVQADVPGAQTPGERYYNLGSDPSSTGRYTMKYKLPKGLTCDGVAAKCVLQWHYLTGNSCNPPGQSAPWRTAGLEVCGVGAHYPEECEYFNMMSKIVIF
jgi:hypothetical protein